MSGGLLDALDADLPAALEQVRLERRDRVHVSVERDDDGGHELVLGRRGPARTADETQQLSQLVVLGEQLQPAVERLDLLVKAGDVVGSHVASGRSGTVTRKTRRTGPVIRGVLSATTTRGVHSRRARATT